MPVHHWTRVEAGTFHHFHGSWITHLSDALNGGLLPEGYYAMSEQHAGRMVADVLTLQTGNDGTFTPREPGLITVTDAFYRTARRTLAIRHASGHQLVALIEILSPGNKDRLANVADFVEKAHAALRHGCHLLIVDLFPPGSYDPEGIHAVIWGPFAPADYEMPDDKPLTLAAYVAGKLSEAYLEHVAVGDALPDMPLFLQRDRYVNVPLETTYQTAYRGVPAYWRGVVEGRG